MNKIYSDFISTNLPVKYVKNIPVILPEKTKADWHRELIEVILWQFPEEIEKMYKEINFGERPSDVSETYIRYIKMLLKDKKGITDAFNSYINDNTEKWILHSDNIEKETLKDFRKLSTKRTGKKRTKTKINATGLFTPYPYFAEETLKNNPGSVLELATGAGGGTAAVAIQKSKDTLLFTVDIGFHCLGNAIGIGKYLKCKDTILPVCANFWYLPFKDDSFDAVCTYCGFDESRENEKTISEITRVLKKDGVLVFTSRVNAFMRQSKILQPFGFTEEETVELLKNCRLYADVESTVKTCEKYGLQFERRKDFEIKENLTFSVVTMKK
ncbi:MAG: methyltransferase domain-containing protein [Clostridia bacterium]|nr:methyltransferase domain-containing protein [Clostridia bacterium]